MKGEVYTGQHEAIVSEDVWSKGAGAAVRRRAAAGDVEERTLRLGLALVFALLMGPWMAHHLARDGR